MRILIVGTGGREHAIAWALAKNEQVERVYFSGHNGGAFGKLVNAELADNSAESLLEFMEKEPIDLVVVGPEQPLSEGLVDTLKSHGCAVFGPEKAAARLESSKAFAKSFMEKYGIPTARYLECRSLQDARAALKQFDYPLVLKADGLCAGKGVSICQDEAEAERTLNEIFVEKIFGSEGSAVVIEEYLRGFEASLLCFVSGTRIYPFDTAMDYKKVLEGDLGPNTGGVGCVSPNPYWTGALDAQSDEILRKIEQGLEAEGLGFGGILFIGYLVQDGRLYVLEFNTRFGDPESEVLLPRLQSDLLENIQQAMSGEPVRLDFDKSHCLTAVLFSRGYPKAYQKGFEITGVENLDPEIILFHNGTKREAGRLLTNGGRVLSVTALGATLAQARRRVYANVEKLRFDNRAFRTDIGARKA